MTEKEENGYSIKLKNYLKNLTDFSEFERKTILYIGIFVALFIFSVFLLYYTYFIDETILYRLVIELFVNPIFNLGFLGIFLFLFIMSLQGVLVPIPSGIVVLAAGIIWGFWIGGIMGIVGSMSASLLCYYVAEKGGRPLAEKFVGKSTIDMTDRLIDKFGGGAIVITRLIPFISFDAISYTAGILRVDVKKYTLATLIGVIPRVFFYTWLGAAMNINPPVNLLELPTGVIEAHAREFNILLLIILVVISALFGTYILYSKLQEKRFLTNDTEIRAEKEEDSKSNDSRNETEKIEMKGRN